MMIQVLSPLFYCFRMIKALNKTSAERYKQLHGIMSQELYIYFCMYVPWTQDKCQHFFLKHIFPETTRQVLTNFADMFFKWPATKFSSSLNDLSKNGFLGSEDGFLGLWFLCCVVGGGGQNISVVTLSVHQSIILSLSYLESILKST